MISTCPRCFSADDVTYDRLPDQVVRFTCARNHEGDGPHSWMQALSPDPPLNCALAAV